jgi:hypothetical protein
MKKSGSGLLIPETRWRARKEAVAATAGPKRREGIAAEARHHEKRKRLAYPRNALEGPRGGYCRHSGTEASRGDSR